MFARTCHDVNGRKFGAMLLEFPADGRTKWEYGYIRRYVGGDAASRVNQVAVGLQN